MIGVENNPDGRMYDAASTGAQVLDDVAVFIGRYLALPVVHALTVLVLWTAHTHAASRFYVTPRLVLDSAEPGSGKTRVLELLALLCRRPKLAINTTTAALYRRLAYGPMTVLLDEVDAIFAPKAAPQHEDLRALLNAGYKRGATVDRCVGDASKMKVQEFPVFAPVALAGLAGRLPGTITSRAITIHMRRRAPGETVLPYYERDAEDDARPLREQLEAWVDAVADTLADARPQMPENVVDRSAEVWEALLAVADAAGGGWPKAAREACTYFVLDADPGELSLGVRLLADLRGLFARRGTDRLPSAEIVTELCNLEEAPWSDLYGKPLDPRRLSKELGRYGVESKVIKLPDGRTPRGYTTHGETGLTDAWTRYLPSGATTATSATAQLSTVADADPVALTNATGHTNATHLTSEVAEVAPVADYDGPDTCCTECNQPLLLHAAGRTTCERCRLDGKSAS